MIALFICLLLQHGISAVTTNLRSSSESNRQLGRNMTPIAGLDHPTPLPEEYINLNGPHTDRNDNRNLSKSGGVLSRHTRSMISDVNCPYNLDRGRGACEDLVTLYWVKVCTHTLDMFGAGTDAVIRIVFCGDVCFTPNYIDLDTPGKDDFERGNVDCFIHAIPFVGSKIQMIGLSPHQTYTFGKWWWMKKVEVEFWNSDCAEFWYYGVIYNHDKYMFLRRTGDCVLAEGTRMAAHKLWLILAHLLTGLIMRWGTWPGF